MTKVRFEIGWHLTFGMKVNSIAQRIDAPPTTMLIARVTERHIFGSDHDPHPFSRISYIWKAMISKPSECLRRVLLARRRNA